MAVKSWQLGYDATTGNFVELDDIAAADPNDPRVIAFENQITAIMEQKGLLAADAAQYVANAYAQGTTLDALKHTAQQTATAEERGDIWGSSGADKGKSFLAAEALKTDQQAYGTSKENAQHLINKLYTEGFGREADAAGLEYWSNALTSGSMSYADIAKSFGASEEAGIRDAYHQEYGRDADDAGLQYWLAHEDGAGAALATMQDAGTLETQLREAYGTHLGQFSKEADRQANIAAGGIWTDVQEGGYKNLNWTGFKEGTVTGATDEEKIASAKAGVTGIQKAGDKFKYDFGSDYHLHNRAKEAGYDSGDTEKDIADFLANQPVSDYMYHTDKRYDDDWETTLDVGQGLSKGDQKTGLAKFQAAILGEEGYKSVNDPYRSKLGSQLNIRTGAEGLEDVRNILAQRERVMHIGATYDKDDAEGGSGIGKMFTLAEMEPYMSHAYDLNDLATQLGAKKWALLTKELYKKPGEGGWGDPVSTGEVIYDPGHNPDERATNRNTLSHDYKVPVPPDYSPNPTANVTRQNVDYMPSKDGTVPHRPLRNLDSSYTTAPQQTRNRGSLLAGTSAQGVRRKQSSAARSGRSAMGTKQLARDNMQIKSLNI